MRETIGIMADKDYKAILAKHGFKDPLGHSLELVTDYQDLLVELERLREVERQYGQILNLGNDDHSAN